MVASATPDSRDNCAIKLFADLDKLMRLPSESTRTVCQHWACVIAVQVDQRAGLFPNLLSTMIRTKSPSIKPTSLDAQHPIRILYDDAGDDRRILMIILVLQGMWRLAYSQT